MSISIDLMCFLICCLPCFYGVVTFCFWDIDRVGCFLAPVKHPNLSIMAFNQNLFDGSHASDDHLYNQSVSNNLH